MLLALAPIALGHALAVAVVLLAVAGVRDMSSTTRCSAGSPASLLIGWALWHALHGHRHRVRVGMQTGLVGLASGRS